MPLALFLIGFGILSAGSASAAPVDFGRDVLPVLKAHCFDCHGPDKQRGGLRLDSRPAALGGGDTGPSLVPGKPTASELIRRLNLAADNPGAMPPLGDRVPPDAIASLSRWIADGAVWPADANSATHWAYQAPQRPVPPKVKSTDWPRSPIDRFVLARLEAENLSPSPEADRATLIRRVSLDLIGLPPSPAEVEAFEADNSPDAYSKLVDQLLASPQFGVRWARPWLDYGRYADSHGFQRDDLRGLWPYRDWVVDALNADMPFDQFTVEQLAGDLLPNATLEQKIATGFNRSAPTNVEAGSDPEETRVNQVIDRVNTVGTVWLGSTIECAQCHDHKYDPFSQADYYRLFAFFNNTAIEADRANPKVPGSIKFLGPEMPLPDATGEARRKNLNAKVAVAKKRLAAAESKTDKAAAKKALTAADKALAAAAPPSTLVMKEMPEHRSTRLFVRGDFRTPGDPISPGTPAVLHRFDGPSNPTRLDLARWLVSPDNPLVARATVNRFWVELFGHGLVTTPEDFGLKGDRPTHPELLDWLAVEFVENGWSTKQLLRTIVLSATYRQASKVTPELLATDDQNVLYARGPRFRMNAEMVRDNALSVAGVLSPKLGGPPVRPPQPAGLWTKVGGEKYDYRVSPGTEQYRRGLYVVWKRSAPYPSFVTFDANNRMTCRVKRPRTNTPLQALTLLNDPVYVEAALAFAARIITDRPGLSTTDRIEYAFRCAVARPPTPDELRILTQLLEAQRENPAGAEELVGKFPRPQGITAAELAAWYAVATAILNLDETITKG